MTDTSHEKASLHEYLTLTAQAARVAYAKCIADDELPWWNDVVITASSAKQARRFDEEIRLRLDRGRLPRHTNWLTEPDTEGTRLGSDGATLNALRALMRDAPIDWAKRRVLIIHSGGDSRRLPQYASAGKLFSALPVLAPGGETSTVFDEFLALSTAWVQCIDCGVLVSSGDVILVFDSSSVRGNKS